MIRESVGGGTWAGAAVTSTASAAFSISSTDSFRTRCYQPLLGVRSRSRPDSLMGRGQTHSAAPVEYVLNLIEGRFEQAETGLAFELSKTGSRPEAGPTRAPEPDRVIPYVLA